MRLLLHRLVTGAGFAGAVLAVGCSSDPSNVPCPQRNMSSLGMATQSRLGLSGDELRAVAVGDYTVMATGTERNQFPLHISVTSQATSAHETAYDSPSVACRSALRIEAAFNVTADGGPVEGAWDGQIIGEQIFAGQATATVRAEATIARAAFTQLPAVSRRAHFTFATSLEPDGLAGSIEEVIEPATDGQQHATESPVIVAQWSK